MQSSSASRAPSRSQRATTTCSVRTTPHTQDIPHEGAQKYSRRGARRGSRSARPRALESQAGAERPWPWPAIPTRRTSPRAKAVGSKRAGTSSSRGTSCPPCARAGATPTTTSSSSTRSKARAGNMPQGQHRASSNARRARRAARASRDRLRGLRAGRRASWSRADRQPRADGPDVRYASTATADRSGPRAPSRSSSRSARSSSRKRGSATRTAGPSSRSTPARRT